MSYSPGIDAIGFTAFIGLQQFNTVRKVHFEVSISVTIGALGITRFLLCVICAVVSTKTSELCQLRYVTLRHITWRCVKLRYVTLRGVTLCDATLCYATTCQQQMMKINAPQMVLDNNWLINQTLSGPMAVCVSQSNLLLRSFSHIHMYCMSIKSLIPFQPCPLIHTP